MGSFGPSLVCCWCATCCCETSVWTVDFSVFTWTMGCSWFSFCSCPGPGRPPNSVGSAWRLNLAKSEAIAVGMTPASALAAHLSHGLLHAPTGETRVLQDFEFLGAAIGRPEILADHAARRVALAQQLLDTIGGLADLQVALRLLRTSAGYARLVHTMRCCPPAGHADVLETFDGWRSVVLARGSTLNPPTRSKPLKG